MWQKSEDQAYDIFGLIKFFLAFGAPLLPLLQNGLKNKKIKINNKRHIKNPPNRNVNTSM